MARTVIFDDRPPHKILLDVPRQIVYADWIPGAIVWLEKDNGERLWAIKHFATGRPARNWGTSEYSVLYEHEVPNEIKAMMLLLI